MPPRTFNPAGRYKQRTQSRQPSTGRLTGYTQSGATDTQAAYTLDALGRTTQAVLTLGRGAQAIRATLQHTYTADGRRDSLTYPDGTIFRHTYQNGRLATAHLPPDHTIRWASYQWNQPTRIDSPGLTRRLDYDPLQRLTRLQVQALGSGSSDAPQGPVLLEHRYTYDPAGNLTQQDTPDGPYLYGYDALDRLTQATPPPALQQTPERPQGLPLERYSYDA
ncbi:MAG: RHS repeat domain-containing protein, partial [Candidatus Contendobacter sp.]